MNRINEAQASQVAASIGKLTPFGEQVAEHNGIAVYRAPGALVGMTERPVFFVEFQRVDVLIGKTKHPANRVVRAWRDLDVPETKDFLLPLFVPFILAPTGLALSAGTYTPRAEALSRKIVALVPFAYAWNDGALSELGDWAGPGQILFSMTALLPQHNTIDP